MKLQLQSDPGAAPRELEFTAAAVTIGRDAQCDIPFPGQDIVSGRHARIEHTASGLLLTDVGSRNGTYLNGKRLEGATVVVVVNDVIQFGQTGPSLRVIDVKNRAAKPVEPPKPAKTPTVAPPKSVTKAPPPPKPKPAEPTEPPAKKGPSPTRLMLLDVQRKHRFALRGLAAAIVLVAVSYGLWLLWGTFKIGRMQNELDRIEAHLQDHDTSLEQIEAKQVNLEKQTREMYSQIAGLEDKVKKTSAAQRDPQDIYKLTVRSAAWILSAHGAGTGCLIDRERRLVVTAYHVIHGYNSADVVFPKFFDGKVLSRADAYEKNDTIHGTVWASDPARDLAILQLESVPSYVPALPLASEGGKQGQRVHTVGAKPEKSVGLWVYSQGNVRESGQKYTYRFDSGQEVNASILRTTNPINGGDSGGPVVNDDCQLVGIVSGSVRDVNLVENIIDLREVRDLLATSPPLLAGLKPLIADVEPESTEELFKKVTKTPPINPKKTNPQPPIVFKQPPPPPPKKPYNPPITKDYDKAKKPPQFTSSGAGVVHILLMMDTADPKIGKSVADDERSLRRTLEFGLHRDNRSITTFSGPNLNSHAIADHIRRINVRPNDAIFCYYSGHGCVMRGTSNHFLSLRSGKEQLYRNDLMNWMAARRARLTVLVSDCCGGFVDFGRGDAEPMATLQEERKGKLFPLFFEHAGHINWNSSSPGELTYSYIFTPAFCNACNMGRLPLGWQGVWNQTYQKTTSDYQNLRKRSMSSPQIRDQPQMRPCKWAPDNAFRTN